MLEPLPGYDDWKLATPPRYEADMEPEPDDLTVRLASALRDLLAATFGPQDLTKPPMTHKRKVALRERCDKVLAEFDDQ